MRASAHEPVMVSEVMEALRPQSGRVYVDCTFGCGGHTRALLERLGTSARVLALDCDPEAVAAGRSLAAQDSRLTVMHARFSQIADLALAEGVFGQADGILFDLGVSSPQLDSAARGFSFREDGPLDMRMDAGQSMCAADWLARTPEREIKRVLQTFGEERYAGRIARAIVRARTERPLTTTAELAALVIAAVPSRSAGGARPRKGTRGSVKHPATRSFQAIRIAVNRELEELDAGLAQVPQLLSPGGRLAVISFHSLEDRIAKRFIRRQAKGEELPRHLPVKAPKRTPAMLPVGSSMRPGSAERQRNPRARSAVLRVAERPR